MFEIPNREYQKQKLCKPFENMEFRDRLLGNYLLTMYSLIIKLNLHMNSPKMLLEKGKHYVRYDQAKFFNKKLLKVIMGKRKKQKQLDLHIKDK